MRIYGNITSKRAEWNINRVALLDRKKIIAFQHPDDFEDSPTDIDIAPQ